DRFGPRRVMLGGACLLGGACVLSSQIGSLWSLYIVTGVLAAAGVCAVSWIPSGALIARWFTERRGRLEGPGGSGTGAGGAGDRPALTVVDRGIWLARRVSRAGSWHAGGARPSHRPRRAGAGRAVAGAKRRVGIGSAARVGRRHRARVGYPREAHERWPERR